MDIFNPGGDGELIDFVSSITDAARLRIEEKLPHGFVRLKVAEAERRQAQHDSRSVEDIVMELLRNSRDAGAKNVLVGFQKEQGRYRKITVIDDGCGIPEELHQLAFEPRVTSKSDHFEEDRYGVHGRGMALFSIRSRAESATIVCSRQGCGTAITLTVDTEKLNERADQATLPRLELVDGIEEIGPGPHNVARVLLEMSVDYKETDLFLGSFAEALATARYLGATNNEDGERTIWSAISSVADARVLAEKGACDLGLPVSERNAYRIMAENIAPLQPVHDLARASEVLVEKGDLPPGGTVTTHSVEQNARMRSPLKRLRKKDMEEIAEGTSAVVEKVVGRYFLKTSGLPKVRRGRGKIIISLFVTGEESEEQ
jgi:hypothetical protein